MATCIDKIHIDLFVAPASDNAFYLHVAAILGSLSIFDCRIAKFLSVYGFFGPASFKENIHCIPLL